MCCPEFLKVTVSRSCDRAKIVWLCAKSWDLYVKTKKYAFEPLLQFSPNLPTGPIRSCSRDVRLSVCLSVSLSPSHAIFCACGLVHASIVRGLVQASIVRGLMHASVALAWSPKNGEVFRIGCVLKSIIKSIKLRFLWYWCYYPHRSRDSVSSVCRIFMFAYEKG